MRWRTSPRRSGIRAVLALLVASLGASAPGAEPPDLADPAEALTAAQRTRVEAGEVVVVPPRKGDPAVGAAVWIRAAPAAVWRVMVDCDKAPEFVPGLRECRVVEERGDVALIEHRVKVMALLPELTYTFRAFHRPYEGIRFHREAGALREMAGEWRLRPHQDGTLVTYAVVLDPGFAIPLWLVRRALRSDLPRLLEALKERVEAQPNHTTPSVEAAQ